MENENQWNNQLNKKCENTTEIKHSSQAKTPYCWPNQTLIWFSNKSFIT